jgi:prepilin peptidase CpaA
MPPVLDFFPNHWFGWCFYAVLVAFLAIASYTDLRWTRIPKWLTLTMLGLGIAFNVARGLWLGLEGKQVWVLSAGPVTGPADGLLFALAGFGVSFAIFLVLFVFNIVGGGDVKLFAALGGWMGPVYVLILYLGTGVTVIALGVVMLVRRVARRGLGRTVTGLAQAKLTGTGGKKKFAGPQPVKGGLTWALPVALSTAIIFPWLFRIDLNLRPHPAPHQDNTQATARP